MVGFYSFLYGLYPHSDTLSEDCMLSEVYIRFFSHVYKLSNISTHQKLGILTHKPTAMSWLFDHQLRTTGPFQWRFFISLPWKHYCNPHCNEVITTKFCTCHDGTAVVTCAEFCSDLKTRNCSRPECNFHQILHFNRNIVGAMCPGDTIELTRPPWQILQTHLLCKYLLPEWISHNLALRGLP